MQQDPPQLSTIVLHHQEATRRALRHVALLGIVIVIVALVVGTLVR